jgi:hypothetical protein
MALPALAACTECGTEFRAHGGAVYCSAACRQRAYRRRQRDTDGGQSIDSLVSALERLTGELEKHTSDMNYTGTDEFNVHTFSRHPFDDSAYDVLQDLSQRIEGVSNDLLSAKDERQNYAALTPQQKTSRTAEFEEMAHEAQASADQETTWKRGATARETAWAALPPEVTAPGRCHDAVKSCKECGGPVETIDDIHRCWACFRRHQDGR